MKISLAIREAASRVYGLKEIKVFVGWLITDFSFLPTEEKSVTPGDGTAVASVLCLPGDEDAGAVAAYARLFEEYSNEYIDEDGDVERVSLVLPRPGEWVKQVRRFKSEMGRSLLDANESDWQTLDIDN